MNELLDDCIGFDGDSMGRQGGPPWPSDAISIESNGISNRSNRNSQTFSDDRKIARLARILMIFERNRSSRHNLTFQNFWNERKIIESIDPVAMSTPRGTFYIIDQLLNNPPHLAETNSEWRISK